LPLQSSDSGITTKPAFTAIREGDDAAWDSRQKVERGAEGPWNGEAGIALYGLPRALFHVGDREPAEGRQLGTGRSRAMTRSITARRSSVSATTA
jgi:hypothetical protein